MMQRLDSNDHIVTIKFQQSYCYDKFFALPTNLSTAYDFWTRQIK